VATELTGAERAAVLVMSLDEEKAVKLLEHMSEKSLAKILEAAERLNVGQIEDDQKRDALQQFFLRRRQGGFFLGDPAQRFRRVLQKAKGDEGIKRLYAEREQKAKKAREQKSAREFLEELADTQFSAVLEKESPRCAAVLLSNVSGEKAGRVLNLLEEEVRERIVQRIISCENIPAEVTDQIIVGFKRKVEEMGPGADAASQERRAQELAAMLRTVDKESQERILAQMKEKDPEFAQEVERQVFGFGDLPKVSDRSMQELLRSVEVTQIAMALKGAPERIRQQFYDNMSQRLRDRVEEEREMTGRVPLSQVEEARDEIMQCARRMYREGQLVVQLGDEQYVE
jgi:flagellar motor switch protein FliG